jgi:hypothetical protein
VVNVAERPLLLAATLVVIAAAVGGGVMFSVGAWRDSKLRAAAAPARQPNPPQPAPGTPFDRAAPAIPAPVASVPNPPLPQLQAPASVQPPILGQPPPASPPPAPQVAQTSAPPPSSAAAKRDNAALVFTLIRTTLVALHQADVTGNYTVLRDLSAPGFRERNSDADLARIFAPVRDAKIDLGAVVILDPHIRQATINDKKMLHIAGTLDTKPVAVNFELLFQPVDGTWRLDGIAVLPVQAQPATQNPAPAPKRKPKK